MGQDAISPEIIFAALSDQTRLRLLALMTELTTEQQVCVCYFVATLGLSQPLISRHLAYLRRSGLVAAERQGKWMYYGLERHSNPMKSAAISSAIEWFRVSDQAKIDHSRFAAACCAPDDFPELRGAPPPVQFQTA